MYIFFCTKGRRRTQKMSNYLATRANKFVQQKQDYDWLVEPGTGGNGQSDWDERLVVTTFPKNLSKAEFEEYIDRKFSELDHKIKERIKALYKALTDIDMEKNVSFDYNTNGSISATLTQMLFEKTSDEIIVSVGYMKFTRKPSNGWHFVQNYWQDNAEKVVKALQYKYGVQLKNELS